MRILFGALMAVALWSTAPAHADMATAQQAFADGDFTRALQLWQSEATEGNADAAWYVGNMYVDGIGIDAPNPFLAAEFFQLAVDQNHVEGMTSLGLLYLQGLGVEQDYAAGAALLFDAAVEGHPVAQVELANLFLVGVPEQVERVPGHAFEWYSLAGGRGVILAQMRVAQMYWDGVGIDADRNLGLTWIAIAYHLSRMDDELYWSNRVFPLDAQIGADGVGTVTLRQAVADLYNSYRFEVPPANATQADQEALAWIAERF